LAVFRAVNAVQPDSDFRQVAQHRNRIAVVHSHDARCEVGFSGNGRATDNEKTSERKSSHGSRHGFSPACLHARSD
jgi:hypothetical protein